MPAINNIQILSSIGNPGGRFWEGGGGPWLLEAVWTASIITLYISDAMVNH